MNTLTQKYTGKTAQKFIDQLVGADLISSPALGHRRIDQWRITSITRTDVPANW